MVPSPRDELVAEAAQGILTVQGWLSPLSGESIHE